MMNTDTTVALAPVHFSTDDTRYEAVRARDPRAERAFVYSVATTGVYCRPTCAARLALRKNVRFHASPLEAERAGFRACLRCRPNDAPRDERHARIVDDVRARIDASISSDASEPSDRSDTSDTSDTSLRSLAAHVGLSPTYLQRLFKKHVGMSPLEYVRARRLQTATARLHEGASVTTAIYDAGFSSSSRFYESGLGMVPSDVQRGGAGVRMRAVVRTSSLGLVLIAATARGVCAVAFGASERALRDELRARFPRAIVDDVAATADIDIDALATRVLEMIERTEDSTSVPIDLIGTAFQQRVWRALAAIPRGTTSTYGKVAKAIGAPAAVRAVGTACGKNPVAVAIPCHRVLREDGALGGYRWGLERKRALLEKERP